MYKPGDSVHVFNFDTLDSTGAESTAANRETFLIVQQGKSRLAGVWSLQDMVQSCQQLTDVDVEPEVHKPNRLHRQCWLLVRARFRSICNAMRT
jgi:hypothetical protein